jgi:hypothetical protein
MSELAVVVVLMLRGSYRYAGVCYGLAADRNSAVGRGLWGLRHDSLHV